MVDVMIVLPERQDDKFSDAMRSLVGAICNHTGQEGGFGLGGENGYSVDYENDVFIMRRFYWGDCDCGSEDRSEIWHAANPHAHDCFQMECARRCDDYDTSIGWAEIRRAAFGSGDSGLFGGMNVESEPIVIDGIKVGVATHMTPRDDPAMRVWRRASDKRDKAHDKIVADLYKERGENLPSVSRWRCTCGVTERAVASDELDHTPTCSIMLPNFEFKPTGFKAEWYKYIGRDNKVSGAMPKDMFAQCLASLK